MSPAPQILGLGEPLVEFTEVDLPGYGPHYRMGFGGDTMNATIAAQRQGARAGYITALGRDMFGDALRALWREEGVDASAVAEDPDAPTGVYFVKPEPAGRAFTYLRKGSAASRYDPGMLPRETIAEARILHVSAISMAVSVSMRAAVAEAMGIAREAGVAVSLDTNLRLALWDLDLARETIFAAIPQTDILFPSEDEAELLTGLTGAGRIADRFLEMGAPLVVLKRGEHGALIATAQGHTEIPPAPSEPVDSTGAGDSFAGAFLAHWLAHGDSARAGRAAAAVAARVVSGYGAIAPIPTKSQIEEDMR